MYISEIHRKEEIYLIDTKSPLQEATNTHNTTKNKVHIVYFFNLIICPVVRVFPLESLVFCVMFCRSLFALLSFFFCAVCPLIYCF
jgi:hypothetical protein